MQLFTGSMEHAHRTPLSEHAHRTSWNIYKVLNFISPSDLMKSQLWLDESLSYTTYILFQRIYQLLKNILNLDWKSHPINAIFIKDHSPYMDLTFMLKEGNHDIHPWDKNVMPTLAFNHQNQSKIAGQFVEWSLYQVQKKKGKFEWNKECWTAFNYMKEVLITPPALWMPMPTDTFRFESDTSKIEAGGTLFQF